MSKTTVTEYRRLLDALLLVKYSGDLRLWSGICGNVDGMIVGILSFEPYSYYNDINHIRANAAGILKHLFRKWKHFSGNVNYPISVNGGKAVSQYYRADAARTQWTKYSAYGRKRWELLDFLIEEVAKKAG